MIGYLLAMDFNQIDAIVSKSLVKPESDIFLSLIDHSFEECRKVLKAKQREGSIIHIKLMSYTSVTLNMQDVVNFFF